MSVWLIFEKFSLSGGWSHTSEVFQDEWDATYEVERLTEYWKELVGYEAKAVRAEIVDFPS